MKLVIHPPVEAHRLQHIVTVAGDMDVVNAADEAEALRAMPEADAFFGKLTPQLLAAARQLRWVQSPTASLEHYIFPELVEHPCQLTNMRGLFGDVIAEQVIGYLIALARNFPRYLRNQIEGKWQPAGGEQARVSFSTGPGVVNDIDRAHRSLIDSTLGIIGFGSIGGEIAKRGAAFGMRVLAIDPEPKRPPEGVSAIWKPQLLPVLLAASDYVVIAAPHTPDTVKLFRRDQFRKMKSTAYLVNIGRGAIVDLDDLVEALKAGELAGAALDVFETEPLPAEHPLWKMENVIITPHVAGYSPRIAERHLGVLLENIRRFVAGQKLVNVCNKAMWY